jgi:hypothetical protein
MRTLFFSVVIGLAAGVICFFISVAFLCFVLLIAGAVSHGRVDMTYAFKVAAPVAILAAFTGFTVTLVRGVRGAIAHR